MKSKKYLMIIVLVVAMLLLGANSSHAALQANGGTPVGGRLGYWMPEIRKMESLEGTLGLTETINNTTLLPTSASNNLDIHMEKNTEYGAIAILSASSYGNPNVITRGNTTTGNNTGIVLLQKSDTSYAQEMVAAAHRTTMNSYYLGSVNKKYWNLYTDKEESAKSGDATVETNGWHSSSMDWPNANRDDFFIGRGQWGKIFTFTCTLAYQTDSYYARAIMICGEGI